MLFSDVYNDLVHGKKISNAQFFGGYWSWENGTIMIHCKDGTTLDIRSTNDVQYTFGFIANKDWFVKEDKE